MNLLADLFLTFARVGVCTFGGGYAMLPILQREVVEKKGWCSEEELADYFAIGQCTPGIIAVNTATFIGAKQRGRLGGVVATLGLIAPSVVIITLIAAFLRNFAHIEAIQHAFGGVRAAVVALIAVSVLKLGKKTVKDLPSGCIFAAVLALALLGRFLPLLSGGSQGGLPGVLTSPVTLVVLAGLAGLLLSLRKGGEDR